MAEWQIGYAADCKSVYLGSTPGSASKYSYLYQLVFIQDPPVARVVKLVDTRDLKSLVRKDVPVQVRPRAPLNFSHLLFLLACSAIIPVVVVPPARFLLTPCIPLYPMPSG
jgi:hypothetical protein